MKFLASHISTILIVLVSSSVRSTLAQQCTLCADGSAPKDGMVAGVTCASLNEMIAGTPESFDDCRSTRLLGYIHCGCPTYPEEYCPMCEKGAFNIAHPQRTIAILGEKTCSEALFQLKPSNVAVKSTSATICQDIKRADYHCGCPNAAAPECSFCDGTASEPARMLPPAFTTSCQGFTDLAAFANTRECATMMEMFPVDAEAYCGCSASNAPPSTCTFCEGNPIPNLDLMTEAGVTCKAIVDMIPFINDAEYCTKVNADFDSCCTGVTTTVPGTPTMAPFAEVHRSSGATRPVLSFMSVLVFSLII